MVVTGKKITKKDFKINDKVFAQFKGFPAWPAIIEKIEEKSKRKTYHVLFFGSYDVAKCTAVNLFPYKENLTVFGTPKRNRPDLIKALEEASTLDYPPCKNSSRSTVINKLMASTPKTNLCSEKNSNDSFSDSSKLLTSVNESDMKINSSGCENNNKINTMLPNEKTCLSILNCKEWITDDSIKSYFDFLSDKIAANNVHLMNPSVAQAVKCLINLSDSLLPANIMDKSFIFIPVNDSEEIDPSFNRLDITKEAGNGSHWSLLLFVKQHSRFYYFDSMENYNLPSAVKIVKQFSKYLNYPQELPIVNVSVPQQPNSFDCGIYVLLFVDILVKNILQNTLCSSDNLAVSFPTLLENDIFNKRGQLAALLYRGQYHNINKKTAKGLLFEPKEVQGLDKNVLLNTIEEGKVKECTTINEKGNHDYITSTKRSEAKDMKTKTQNNFSLKKKKNKLNKCFNYANSNASRVAVYGDSHAKNCYNTLQQIFDHCKTSVTCSVHPGAPLSYIYNKIPNEVSDYTKKDAVVLIGGTNSIDCEFNYVYPLLTELVGKLSHTNVILTTVPYRYDQPHQNDKVRKLNEQFHSIVKANSDLSFIPINNLLCREHYTRHGLHLNNRGKQLLCTAIGLHVTVKLNPTTETKNVNRIQNKPHPSKLQNKNDDDIRIIEGNMEEIIKKSSKEGVAFAHCISADLDCTKSMSAGVAVSFKHMFGKPTPLDCINKNLTCQKTNEKSIVYGLITKPSYYSKPEISDYDMAFTELTADFKRKGLKKLICSPLGCVRDQIPLNHFANNITKFQRITGANVQIITYNETSSRLLRNGLTYDDFLDSLQHHISERMLKQAMPVLTPDGTLMSNFSDNQVPESQTTTAVLLHPYTTMAEEQTLANAAEDIPSPIKCKSGAKESCQIMRKEDLVHTSDGLNVNAPEKTSGFHVTQESTTPQNSPSLQRDNKSCI